MSAAAERIDSALAEVRRARELGRPEGPAIRRLEQAVELAKKERGATQRTT